ncbi:MAG: S41 family peptidase [Patescibacteria group bacterium]
MKKLRKYSLKKSFLTTLAIVGVVIAFGMGMFVQKKIDVQKLISNIPSSHVLTAETGNIDMETFIKTYDILNMKFIPTTASSTIPTNDEKIYGAIEGLTASYGDPYTVFFPPKESAEFAEEVRGDFSGIGLEIAIKDEMLTAVSPLKNSPAEQAGIKPGDVIVKIDNKFTTGISVEEAVSRIRGPKGTTVVLTIRENGSAHEVSIKRDIINIPVLDTKLRDDGVFVISLYNFSANSPEYFRNALREFVLSGSDKLILDLRNNPGGYLESSVDMASWFLPVGKTVVIEDEGINADQKALRSKGYDIFNSNLKMTILINEGSASASEILAGALNEHGIANLVGEKSFGKGSVQELIEITPETSLKVTIARWLTPNGHSISENGLEPDVKVEFTKADIKNKYDRQLETAAKILLAN